MVYVHEERHMVVRSKKKKKRERIRVSVLHSLRELDDGTPFAHRRTT